MNTKDFKCIVGELEKDKPAVIRFFGPVNEYTVSNFNYEFLYIVQYIKPSKIQVQINSEGGSILHGMSTYSIINNSEIPTECVIEGMAASTASIIWAAGTVSKMRDYGILMIHNPFSCKEDKEDEEDKCGERVGNGCGKKVKSEQLPVIEAFKTQIETIYMKRWGLSKAKVKEIMEGEEGQDGTFFDAAGAVSAGIIKEENIIKTTKQKADKVKNIISDIKNSIECREAISKFLVCETAENKLEESVTSNLKTEQGENEPDKSKINNTQNSTKMIDENKLDLSLVTASLGMPNLQAKDVVSHLSGLVETKRKYDDLVKTSEGLTETHNALKIENAGNVAKLGSMEKELTAVKASLSVFEAEKKALVDQEIDKTVQDAINAGKIKNESKAEWVSMAASNFEMVKNTLASIPAAENIPAAIASDVENRSAGAATEADKVQAKIKEVLGDFKYPTPIR